MLRYAARLAAAGMLAVVSAAGAFDLQGHRGARGLAPENTLAGFARAVGIGVTTLEMDVGVTRDGAVVVHHDPTLNPDTTRGPDGNWVGERIPIKDLTLAELRAHDVGRLRPGTRYAARYPGQEPADGERVPTLEEVIDLTTRLSEGRIRYNIEVKVSPDEPDATGTPEAMTDAVIGVLRRTGAARRVTVQSFDWRVVVRVRERAPDIDTACLTVESEWRDTVERGKPGASPWTAGLDIDDYGGSVPRLVAAACAPIWSPYFKDIDAASVAEAHALALRVVPWTVNETADMERLLDAGVDGIITDYPDRLAALLRGRGRRWDGAPP